jgi:hypothetical protein
MKKILLFITTCMLMSFSVADPITKEERKKAVDFLKEIRQGVLDATKGLSEAQLKFKPAADKWSVEDCVKHIAQSQQMLWDMVSAGLKNPATPEKRAEVKWSDDDVIKNIESRANKVKTSPPMEPLNTPFKSLSEAWDAYSKNTDKIIEYVNTTNDDLRNHITTMPFASFDSYQMVLFIGAHAQRHTQQMNEVKADPNFPKN